MYFTFYVEHLRLLLGYSWAYTLPQKKRNFNFQIFHGDTPPQKKGNFRKLAFPLGKSVNINCVSHLDIFVYKKVGWSTSTDLECGSERLKIQPTFAAHDSFEEIACECQCTYLSIQFVIYHQSVSKLSDNIALLLQFDWKQFVHMQRTHH